MHWNKLGRVYNKGQRTDINKRMEVADLYATGLSFGEMSAKTGISDSGCRKIVESFLETGTLEKTGKKTLSPTKLTYEVSSIIEFEKTKKPSIYGREIRSKLLETGVCTNDNLPSVTLINNHIKCTGGHLIIGRNSRFIGYFVTKTKKNTEKNYRRFKVNSSSIRQYTFCLEIQSIN